MISFMKAAINLKSVEIRKKITEYWNRPENRTQSMGPAPFHYDKEHYQAECGRKASRIGELIRKNIEKNKVLRDTLTEFDVYLLHCSMRQNDVSVRKLNEILSPLWAVVEYPEAEPFDDGI